MARRPPVPGDGAHRPRNAGFDDRPEEYDAMRAVGHMARRRADFFAQVIDRRPGLVLEIGCGTGTLLRTLAARRPDRQFVGIEPLANYVGYARAQAEAAGIRNVRFEVGTGEVLEGVVPERSVDVVLSVDALHHVHDQDHVARALARVSVPDARWWAMEPNRIHPYVWAYHVLTPGERTFSPRAFLRRARAAGWELEHRRNMYLFPSGVTSVPAWAEALERRLERYRPLAGAVVLELRRV